MAKVSCWLDWNEWAKVFHLLYNFQNSTKQFEGISHVQAWKSRGKLPVSVECTANLISAMLRLESETTERGKRSESNLQVQLSSAMSLIRFVNGMTERGQKGLFARSVQSIADEIELPSWLVDLRHDATHSSLPSLAMLKTGINVALSWLKNHYWDKTFDAVFDTAAFETREELASLLQKYVDAHILIVKEKERRRKSLYQEWFQPLANSMRPLLNAANIRTSLVPEIISVILLPVFYGNDTPELSEIATAPHFWKHFFTSLHKSPSLPVDLAHNVINIIFEKDTVLHNNDGNINVFVDFIELLIKNFINEREVAVLAKSALRLCLRRPNEFSSYLLKVFVPLGGFSRSLEEKLIYFAELVESNSLCMNMEEKNITFSVLDENSKQDCKEYDSHKNVEGETSCSQIDKEETHITSWQVASDIDWTSIPLGEIVQNKNSANTDCTSDFGFDQSIFTSAIGLDLPMFGSHIDVPIDTSNKSPSCELNTNFMDEEISIDYDDNYGDESLLNDGIAKNRNIVEMEIEHNIPQENVIEDNILMNDIIIF